MPTAGVSRLDKLRSIRDLHAKQFIHRDETELDLQQKQQLLSQVLTVLAYYMAETKLGNARQGLHVQE